MEKDQLTQQPVQITKQENNFLPIWLYWVYGLLLFLPPGVIFLLLVLSIILSSGTDIADLILGLTISFITFIPILPGLFLLIFTYKKKTNKLIDSSVKFGMIAMVLLIIYYFVVNFSTGILGTILDSYALLVGLMQIPLIILVIIANIFLIVGLFKSKVSRI